KGRRVSLLAGFVLAGCNPNPTDGTEPTLAELSAPGVCRGTPSAFPDPELESLFESRLESYCLDPNAPPRTYEHAASTGVDDLCSELAEEQCRSLKQFGLRRLTTLRYIRDDGSPAAVNVVLSRFATT